MIDDRDQTIQRVLRSIAEDVSLESQRPISHIGTSASATVRRKRLTAIGAGVSLIVAAAAIPAILSITGVGAGDREPVSAPRPMSDLSLNAYPTALMSGRLVLVDGCLRFGASAVALLPPGSRWEGPDHRSVRLENGSLIALNEAVTLGGGVVPYSETLGLAIGPDARGALEGCLKAADLTDVAIVSPY